jgi:hypothetical protein
MDRKKGSDRTEANPSFFPVRLCDLCALCGEKASYVSVLRTDTASLATLLIT